jgi:hypothetical protein
MKDNPVVKCSLLDDGDKMYKLCFNFNSLAVAEEITGQNLLKALDMSAMSISSVRGLLYATLLKFNPKVSLAEAGDILQRCGVKAVIEKVIEAWSLSQPDPEIPNEEPEEESDPATK